MYMCMCVCYASALDFACVKNKRLSSARQSILERYTIFLSFFIFSFLSWCNLTLFALSFCGNIVLQIFMKLFISKHRGIIHLNNTCINPLKTAINRLCHLQ